MADKNLPPIKGSEHHALEDGTKHTMGACTVASFYRCLDCARDVVPDSEWSAYQETMRRLKQGPAFDALIEGAEDLFEKLPQAAMLGAKLRIALKAAKEVR